ncbi:8-oxo-dGTP diphosphatase [Paenibacillus sp. S3N08]|uniref:8-oxo-dGTP diphosphatase n=1 Tax=Paenibacillus agricola TaxID=2716264 RepID=A0ABX0JAP0_9BACL|nr:8-oxo-dGTP diphosphatase [Paenibacillus agricola]
MLKYNICFFKQGNHILLLNRESPSWMGCWNGVGGKLEPGETPRQSMIREISEETGIHESQYQLTYKGMVTWTVDGGGLGGMYLYIAELGEDIPYETPVKTVEGILDWKSIEWIMHSENRGVAANIPIYLNYIVHDQSCYEHYCTFKEGKLLDHCSKIIESSTEDRAEMNKYLMSKSFAI